MKLLIAVIQPQKLIPIREALEKIDVTRLSVGDAFGYDRFPFAEMPILNKEETEPAQTTVLQRKIVLEIAVNDDFLEPTIEILKQIGHSGGGTFGKGRIFVLPLENAIRIGETVQGPGAI